MLAKGYLTWKEARYLEAATRSADFIWKKGLLRKGAWLSCTTSYCSSINVLKLPCDFHGHTGALVLVCTSSHQGTMAVLTLNSRCFRAPLGIKKIFWRHFGHVVFLCLQNGEAWET